MAVRNDFVPGEILASQDLNDTFAEKVPFAYGTATPSTTVEGFVWYDENDTPPTPKFWDGAAFQALTSGKILQIVRATDGTARSTTSTSFVDASISVTITPQKSTSAVLLVSALRVENPSTGRIELQITDSSNNAISGVEAGLFQTSSGFGQCSLTLIAYATPATTAATTFKLRFRVNTGTGFLQNASQTGQLYAIEVSA
jgi:phage terminase large subunit-like protein